MSKNEILDQLRQNSKKRGGNRAKNRKYTVILDGNMNVKLSPQAITCLEILFAGKVDGMMEENVIGLIENNVEKYGDTKQSPWKIFQYYRKSLVDAGFLKVEKTDPESK